MGVVAKQHLRGVARIKREIWRNMTIYKKRGIEGVAPPHSCHTLIIN